MIWTCDERKCLKKGFSISKLGVRIKLGLFLSILVNNGDNDVRFPVATGIVGDRSTWRQQQWNRMAWMGVVVSKYSCHPQFLWLWGV